jgi:transcriptional antiterminator NusG
MDQDQSQDVMLPEETSTDIMETEDEQIVEPIVDAQDAVTEEATTSVAVESVMEEDEKTDAEITAEAAAQAGIREKAKAAGSRWYVLSTRAGYEKKVARLIEQRVKAGGLEEQVVQVVVPTQEKVIAKGGKKRTIEEKIFPGYVLINMIITDDTWHVVRNTEGVTGFVGPSKKPSPLSETEVKAIMAFTEVKQTSYESAYRVGDAVKVIDGPFKELIGNIQNINEDKGQLTVLLSMFGREVPVQLDFLQVSSL